jgi:hypothetical protein
MGGAASPPAAQPHPDARVGGNIAHVLGLFAELRDEPELVPTSLPPNGVRRGSPDLRPVVSSSVCVGSRRINGFATRFWKKLVTAALGMPLISHHPSMVGPAVVGAFEALQRTGVAALRPWRRVTCVDDVLDRADCPW